MYQFVDANQFSPRANVVYKPTDYVTFHAGYARTFTPPSQVIATPTNVALFAGTTAQPEVLTEDPVLPERANVYDAGMVWKPLPGLEVGIDGYYKEARDLLDDGQFGQALVLSGFNYETRHQPRRGAQGRLHVRRLPRLRQHRLGQAAGDQHRLQPVPVRTSRARLHRHPLDLHGPYAALDRVGRHVLPVERDSVQR